MRHTRPRAQALRETAAVVAATVIARLPLLSVPFERDDASYGLLALEALRGRLPYRDLVALKPPLLYLLYLPVAWLGGPSPVAQRLLGLVFPVTTSLLVLAVARRLLPERAAVAAALLCAVASADPGVQGCILNAETLMLVPATAAMLLWWRAVTRGGIRLAAGAGACLALACLVKPPALPQALVVLAAPSLAIGAGLLVPFSAGAAAVGAVTVLGLAAAGLLPAVTAWLREGTTYVQSPGLLAAHAEALASLARTQSALWVLAGLGFAAGRWPRGGRRFTALWTAGAALGVLMGRRAFPHYFLQLVPPLCVAAGAGVAVLLTPRPRPAVRAAGWIAAGMACLAATTVLPLLLASRDVQARTLYPDNYFLEAEQVAARVRALTPPDSELFVAGSEPEIPLLAGRRLAGRYPFIYHLARPDMQDGPEQAQWLAELDRPAVAAAVVCDFPTSWNDLYGTPAVVRSLRARVLTRLATADYREAEPVPPYRIFLRTR